MRANDDGARARRRREVAAVAEEIAAARVERGTSTDRQTDEPVRVVCVVGLAHCNGVVDRLAAMDVERWR